MSFLQFAQSHGLVIRHLDTSGSIKRCGTESHPNTKNGSYCFDGKGGWVQNWEFAEEPVWFESDKEFTPAEKAAWAAKKREQDKLIAKARREAAINAAKVLNSCELLEHSYLEEKGFKDEKGLVITTENRSFLVIPMYSVAADELTGCQYISEEEGMFHKRFAPCMRAEYAVHRIGRGKVNILCEGYATGLSLAKAVKMGCMDVSIVVCFSAGNMVKVAKLIGDVVAADNDKSGTGERAAQSTGLPYLMPEIVGQDWNDVHLSGGIFNVVQAVRQMVKLAE